MLVHALVAAVIAVATPVPPGVVSGVDVATWQAGIDFTRVRADGHGFAIVKAGGSQLDEGPYTSTHYRTQIAGARAAGLRVGHYWLAGDFSTPVHAADYFADHLHDYRRGDVLALDNEVLDDSTRLWNDTDVAAFFTRVHDRVGDHVPWLYMGAADLRSGTWSRTIATGTKLWVASWGANDGSYPGEPNLGGTYPTWSAHQYTSNGSVGGTRVDLNVARPGAFDVVTPPGGPPKLPKTSTEQDGIPGTVFWQRAQNWLSMEWGYIGPVDGVMGPNSWRGFARFLNQDAYG